MPNDKPDAPAYKDTIYELDAVTARLRLVNQYNYLVGPPDATIAELQRLFVSGRMTNEDLEGMAELYRYVMNAIESSKAV